METKDLNQQGNTLQGNFEVTHDASLKILNVTSPQYICGPVYFQVNVTSAKCFGHNNSGEVNMLIFVKFMKMYEHDDLNYSCKLSSKKLDVCLTFNDDNIWHKIYCHNKPGIDSAVVYHYNFDISACMDITKTDSPFAALYDDIYLTDFELKGEDGSVKMHKAVLASCSPVMKTMLQGKWKETTDGRVDVVGVTKQTLEQFKDYVYLQKLPQSGLDQLLLLASYYMMPDLVQKCSVKLLNSLTAQNAFELSEFAIKYKVNNIFLSILRCVQNGVIKVEDMPAYSNWNDICKEAAATFSK